MQIRPVPGVTPHHGSPAWKRGVSPPAAAIRTKARAIVRRYAIPAALAGEISVEGGTHPVSAGAPWASRCFQAPGACASNNS
jgi:hypothetical protein